MVSGYPDEASVATAFVRCLRCSIALDSSGGAATRRSQCRDFPLEMTVVEAKREATRDGSAGVTFPGSEPFRGGAPSQATSSGRSLSGRHRSLLLHTV